jgi:hypothetical protein
MRQLRQRRRPSARGPDGDGVGGVGPIGMMLATRAARNDTFQPAATGPRAHPGRLHSHGRPPGRQARPHPGPTRVPPRAPRGRPAGGPGQRGAAHGAAPGAAWAGGIRWCGPAVATGWQERASLSIPASWSPRPALPTPLRAAPPPVTPRGARPAACRPAAQGVGHRRTDQDKKCLRFTTESYSGKGGAPPAGWRACKGRQTGSLYGRPNLWSGAACGVGSAARGALGAQEGPRGLSFGGRCRAGGGGGESELATPCRPPRGAGAARRGAARRGAGLEGSRRRRSGRRTIVEGRRAGLAAAASGGAP